MRNGPTQSEDLSLGDSYRPVTKNKLTKERDVLKLRNKERSLIDELNAIKAETHYFSEQLEALKRQLTHSKQQISMIEMCNASEDVKIAAHTSTLNEHLEGYQQIFDNEQKELELRIKEQRDKEAEQLEFVRQKEMQIAEENERKEREAAAIEEECDAIERECVVLKKRNNAILLKLRKKLLETENLRRERIKRNSVSSVNDTT
ncbi:uncharacterized protein LOC142980180 [Anticarsia gemmatalis]|uniref:uncharacterized protein LOC142980180 n=1 Tax=Anticarsia gemmatalis TaxID=129554 RepID=UPI003F778084